MNSSNYFRVLLQPLAVKRVSSKVTLLELTADEAGGPGEAGHPLLLGRVTDVLVVRLRGLVLSAVASALNAVLEKCFFEKCYNNVLYSPKS